MKALTQQTSRLPSVSLSRSARGDFPVVASDTESAIRGGVIRGFVAMVDGLVDAICEEKNFPKDIPVIATGGFSGYLRGLSTRVTHFEPDLTLEGLYAISKH
jgi:type III pantothenate kinase